MSVTACMFQLASAESVQTVMRSLDDPNEEKIKLVCPTNGDHDLWYPVGLLDIEPAPWCLCVPLDSTVPLTERDNRMRPVVNLRESNALRDDHRERTS